MPIRYIKEETMDYKEMDIIRVRLGWNKKELAQRLGLDERTVYGYYRTKKNIPEPTAKLIRAFDGGYREKEE